MEQPAATLPPEAVVDANDKLSKQATWSLISGVIALFGLFPLIQLPAAIVSIVLGVRSLSSARRGQAIAGIVLSAASLLVLAWIVWAFVDAVNHVGLDNVFKGYWTD